MSKIYKIAIDGRRLRQTTGRYVRELLNNLEKIDSINQYHVIIHAKDVGCWEPKASNFRLHVVDWDHYTLGEQIGFNSFLKNLDADLVHFCMPQQPYLYKRRKVTTIHDLTLVKFNNPSQNQVKYWAKKQIFKFILKNAALTSEKIFTDANYTASEIVSYINVSKEKIIVAHPASDAMPQKSKTYPPAKNKEYILYTGNAFPYKNLPRLIKSHQKLLKNHPNLYLFIVGKKDDNIQRLENNVSLNNYKQIEFTDFVTDEQLSWLYQNAKAYVFPSLSEGFGMPGLEAMQFDLPVVSSDATCLPEIYGDAAHYFDPENIEEMTQSIHEVLSDSTLRNSLINNGKLQVNRYKWYKMAKQIYSEYINVLKD